MIDTAPAGWREVPPSKFKPSSRAFEGPCDFCKKLIRRTTRDFAHAKQYCSKRCAGRGSRPLEQRIAWRRGRAWVYRPDHPYATKMSKHEGYILRSRAVAEAAFGRVLPKHANFHHVNERPAEDRPGNLVICDRSFHRWIHNQLEKKRFGTTARHATTAMKAAAQSPS